MITLRKVQKILPNVTVITGRNEVLAKVIFLHLSVILFTGGEGFSLPDPPGRRTPPGWRNTPPMENPPRWRNPPGWRTPPDGEPPGWRTPPPPEADSGIWSVIGRYTSYWNAFLSENTFQSFNMEVYERIFF